VRDSDKTQVEASSLMRRRELGVEVEGKRHVGAENEDAFERLSERARSWSSAVKKSLSWGVGEGKWTKLTKELVVDDSEIKSRRVRASTIMILDMNDKPILLSSPWSTPEALLKFKIRLTVFSTFTRFPLRTHATAPMIPPVGVELSFPLATLHWPTWTRLLEKRSRSTSSWIGWMPLSSMSKCLESLPTEEKLGMRAGVRSSKSTLFHES
jgi:hypothetical protein